MSLYSSLTQVLAPFAAKINGLLTGWDGTKYTTPGEAVRTQISDLHVLIGDVPGVGISGSAVSYDGTESGVTATNMQGAVDELSGDLSDTNERLGNLSDLETEDKSNIVNAINEAAQSGGSGLTADIKDALLQLAQKVAYIDANGQDYYDALYNALYPTIRAISAMFSQGSAVVYDTEDLSSLKQYLTVTAIQTDGSRVTLSNADYSLSGTLSAGTSTIIVSYGNKTDTFDVVVTADSLVSISAEYTQGGAVYTSDTLAVLINGLNVTAIYTSGGTEEIASSNYTLSGTLTAGTSTITVSYEGQTDTFNVTVTQAIDYTADAFANVTWTSGYKYDVNTGELVAASNENCTDKFTVQDCLYQLKYNGSALGGYPAIFMWDENDNYLGNIESSNGNFGYIRLDPDKKYAIKTYNSSFNSSLATMTPVDNRATSADSITINLADLTLSNFIGGNGNTAEYNLTSVLSAVGITPSNYTSAINDISVRPFGLGSEGKTYVVRVFDGLTGGLFASGSNLMLQIKRLGSTTSQAVWEQYVADNNISITFN